MTKDRWVDIVATVSERFTIKNKGKVPVEDGPGTIEFIEFTSPVGEVRLEFSSHPRVVGKKAFGGRRVGTATSVAYEFDPKEEVHEMVAYRQVNGQWEEIDATSFLG